MEKETGRNRGRGRISRVDTGKKKTRVTYGVVRLSRSHSIVTVTYLVLAGLRRVGAYATQYSGPMMADLIKVAHYECTPIADETGSYETDRT